MQDPIENADVSTSETLTKEESKIFGGAIDGDITNYKKDENGFILTPKNFIVRNMQCISPEQFYNHKSQTFQKNKRKGL